MPKAYFELVYIDTLICDMLQGWIIVMRTFMNCSANVDTMRYVCDSHVVWHYFYDNFNTWNNSTFLIQFFFFDGFINVNNEC